MRESDHRRQDRLYLHADRRNYEADHEDMNQPVRRAAVAAATWDVYLDNSRLEGEESRFSACQPAFFNMHLFDPKTFFQLSKWTLR